jgi:hypothetical protein
LSGSLVGAWIESVMLVVMFADFVFGVAVRNVSIHVNN